MPHPIAELGRGQPEIERELLAQLAVTLPAPVAVKSLMLAPGERVDATLDILDPGKDAEGFEIDVCLRNAKKRIVCAGDAATPVK